LSGGRIGVRGGTTNGMAAKTRVLCEGPIAEGGDYCRVQTELRYRRFREDDSQFRVGRREPNSVAWVRKSDEEIARQRRRLWLSFRWPLFWALLFWIASIFRGGFGPTNGVTRWFTGWREMLRYNTNFCIWLFLVIYFLQIIFQRKMAPFAFTKVVICNSCHAARNASTSTKCQCGGEFEDFENWKWVDD
jgi:hypothetical protein